MLYCSYGALAQLGARNIRIVKATGSIPVCSTYKAARRTPEATVYIIRYGIFSTVNSKFSHIRAFVLGVYKLLAKPLKLEYGDYRISGSNLKTE